MLKLDFKAQEELLWQELHDILFENLPSHVFQAISFQEVLSDSYVRVGPLERNKPFGEQISTPNLGEVSQSLYK